LRLSLVTLRMSDWTLDALRSIERMTLALVAVRLSLLISKLTRLQSCLM
jgi:hypothetical protein